jgi:hypothetical protein
MSDLRFVLLTVQAVLAEIEQRYPMYSHETSAAHDKYYGSDKISRVVTEEVRRTNQQ